MPAPLVAAAGARLLPRILKIALPMVALALVIALTVGLGLVRVFLGGAGNEAGSSGEGGCTVSGASTTQVVSVQGLDAEQTRNAQTIVAVGRQLQVPAKGWVIALAVAMTESKLRNVNYGDHSSLGLFQQLNAWGSAEQRTDPAGATRMFFQGGGKGQDGLLDVAGWESLSIRDAAHDVQHSAFPDRVSQYVDLATQLVGQPAVEFSSCVPSTVSANGGAEGFGGQVVAEAMKWLGTDYAWGGGSLDGPTRGFAQGASYVGFDCSSLTRYAVFHATGGQVTLPRTADAQGRSQPRVPAGEALRAGDLLLFSSDGSWGARFYHIGIADGRGGMVQAPRTGKTVEVVENVMGNSYYAAHYAGAIRPVGGQQAGAATVAAVAKAA
jgi:cell wall-associated NlpC family hydrolase